MISIQNHRAHLDGVPVEWRPSPNVSGLIEPQLIVLHETAGHLTHGNSAGWLCTPRAKASAHVTIERDGSIIQLVDFNRAAWHAGVSEWQGRKNCNGWSIGIELVGPGVLYARGKDKAVSTFGLVLSRDECVEVDSQAHGGNALWLPFTPEQIATCEALVAALKVAYPRITDVAGHYEVSPGRKVDPSPLYPIERCKALFIDREAPDYGLVKAAQEKLVELGYDAGDVDGTMGPRTRGALRTFQDVNSIPVSGEIDEATATRLASDDALPMPTGTRTETTKADVQPRATWWAKRGTEVEGLRTAADAVDKSQDAISKFAKAKSTGEQGSVLIDWVMSPLGMKTVVTFAVLGAIWFAMNNVDWAAVRARVKGLALGRA